MIFKSVFLCAVLLPEALAYVDPGSGMAVWQGIVAAIGAVLVFLRNPLQVIKAWIRSIRKK